MTNLPWSVYSCDKISAANPIPRNETFVSGHLTATEAMEAANKLQRENKKLTFTVGQS
jgi:hypothetical protein